MANIGSAARQAILEIGIAFKIFAPGLAPEGSSDRPALKDHRRDLTSLLSQLFQFPRGDRWGLGDWHVGTKAIIAHAAAPSVIAALRSSATSRSSSRSSISVRFISAPAARKSPANWRFDSINRSIFASIVPRQTNLCTSTLRLWPMR